MQTTRADILAAAREGGWAWREDPTNARPVSLRNRVRQSLLPGLEAEAPGADRRIAAAAADLRDLRDGLADWLDRLSEGDRLDLGALAALPAGLRRALLAEAVARHAPEVQRSRALVERLEGLVEAAPGASVESGVLRVWRERDGLRLKKEAASPGAGALAVTPLDHVPDRFDLDPLSVVVDADLAGAPVLRLWHDGDRLQPLGMDGTKLVSDLLRERGVPRALRADVPVVASGPEVWWVVGHRLSARVAVGPGTRRAARWTWVPPDG